MHALASPASLSVAKNGGGKGGRGGGKEREKKEKRKRGGEKKRKFEDSYLRYSTDAQQNLVLVGLIPSMTVIHEMTLILRAY